MLQNARVTAFTVSELLRENQHGGEWEWVKKRDVREMLNKSILESLEKVLQRT